MFLMSVVQFDTMKCFPQCPQKDVSLVPWDSLPPADPPGALSLGGPLPQCLRSRLGIEELVWPPRLGPPHLHLYSTFRVQPLTTGLRAGLGRYVRLDVLMWHALVHRHSAVCSGFPLCAARMGTVCRGISQYTCHTERGHWAVEILQCEVAVVVQTRLDPILAPKYPPYPVVQYDSIRLPIPLCHYPLCRPLPSSLGPVCCFVAPSKGAVAWLPVGCCWGWGRQPTWLAPTTCWQTSVCQRIAPGPSPSTVLRCSRASAWARCTRGPPQP